MPAMRAMPIRPQTTAIPAIAPVLSPPPPLFAGGDEEAEGEEFDADAAGEGVDVDCAIDEVEVRAEGTATNCRGGAALKVSLVGDPTQPLLPQHRQLLTEVSHWTHVCASPAECIVSISHYVRASSRSLLTYCRPSDIPDPSNLDLCSHLQNIHTPMNRSSRVFYTFDRRRTARRLGSIAGRRWVSSSCYCI